MKSRKESKRTDQEIELKLTIDPKDVNRLLHHPLLEHHAVAEQRTDELRSIYYDTPDFFIKKHGASLRVRELESGFIQTLKESGMNTGGLYDRREWEVRTINPLLDLSALRDVLGKQTLWGKRLDDPVLAQLQPIFETRVSRTIRELQLPDGCAIEFALDQGGIHHHKKIAPISEVELELISGDRASLVDFALELVDSLPMHITSSSKSARGYALVLPAFAAAPVIKASAAELSGRMPIERGFRLILADCIAQIHGNALGVMRKEDSEQVHQMRIGLRRLHSLIRLFDDVIACPDRLRLEMDWLVSQLGPARDWDVLCSTTLPQIEQIVPADIAMAHLEKAALDIAHRKKELAAQAVKSVRFTRLILLLSAWWNDVARGHASCVAVQGKSHSSLQKFADKALKQAHERMRKRGKMLREADAAERHHFRIATKRVRYATEFFQSLYSPEPVEKYVNALSHLQDEAGWLNDAVIADALLVELKKNHRELATDIGFVRGYLLAVAEPRNATLSRLWKRIHAVEMPLPRRAT